MEKAGPPPPRPNDIRAFREFLEIRKKELAEVLSDPDGTTGLIENDITVTARDGYEVPVRIHCPETPPADGSPLVIIFHGGGFCLGNLDAELVNCRNIAKAHGATVVNVDYRLAPEHPFPAAPNDSWDVLKWVSYLPHGRCSPEQP
jgi:acetyl esterase/lipase